MAADLKWSWLMAAERVLTWVWNNIYSGMEVDKEVQRYLELLAHPELRTWVSGLWTDFKATLRDQAADPDSEVRTRLTGALVSSTHRVSRSTIFSPPVKSWPETSS